jgi:pilus assembly protein Flp/PilA
MSKIKNWAINKAVKLQTAREEGQGLAEYGLILALISVVCIIALMALGASINGVLGDINAAF